MAISSPYGQDKLYLLLNIKDNIYHVIFFCSNRQNKLYHSHLFLKQINFIIAIFASDRQDKSGQVGRNKWNPLLKMKTQKKEEGGCEYNAIYAQEK